MTYCEGRHDGPQVFTEYDWRPLSNSDHGQAGRCWDITAVAKPTIPRTALWCYVSLIAAAELARCRGAALMKRPRRAT